MIIEEVKESLNRRKLFSSLICIGIVIFLFAVTTLFLNYSYMNSRIEKVEPLKGLKSYQLSDTLLEDSEFKEFTSDPNSLQRVKKFYNELENNLGEKYLYIFDQPIELNPNKTNGIEKFIDEFGDGSKGPNGYAFKAVQMNQQAFNGFSVEVHKGKSFVPEDFKHNSNKNKIPVLLGAEYENIYKIGDVLLSHYLNKNFELVVKGFVRPNTLVSNSNHPELFLDRYIVMPAQQFTDPANEEELSFQVKHYFQIINGSIYSAEKRNVISSKLDNIKDTSDFPYMTIIGVDDLPFQFLFSALHENIQWVIIFSIALFIVCILSLSVLMMTKIQDNYKNMSIHLVSGATMNQLYRYILVEIIVTIGIPCILTILLYTIFVDILLFVYVAFILFCVLIMMLLSIVPIYLQFRMLKISRLLKRSE